MIQSLSPKVLGNPMKLRNGDLQEQEAFHTLRSSQIHWTGGNTGHNPHSFPAKIWIFHSLGGLLGCSSLSSMYFYFWIRALKPTEGVARRLYCLFCLCDAVQELCFYISSETCVLKCYALLLEISSFASVQYLIWILTFDF